MTISLSRMVLPVASSVAALAACAGVATAQQRQETVAQSMRSPLLGTWELDLTRMPETYGASPKRVVYTIEDIGSGLWRTTIDITAPDDSTRHMTVTYQNDGKMAPGGGDTSEADSAAILVPAPNVLVMGLAKSKTLASVRVYTVSSDRKEMTEAAANVDGAGNPFVRKFYFKRIR